MSEFTYSDNFDAEARCGMITASKIADILPGKRGSYLKSRSDYIEQIAVERLTGQSEESFSSKATDWGNEQEPHAIAAYEAAGGLLVQAAPYAPHPEFSYSGASPDGLISDDTGVEVKCPWRSINHLRCFVTGEMPEGHAPQVQWQMACAKLERVSFVSFDPRMPDHLQLFTIEVARDQTYIDMLEAEVVKLEDEIQKYLASLPGAK